MRQRTEQEEMMVQYLLGRLLPEEESRVEEQFFADSQFFEQLLAVEAALIDSYLLGELSGYERELFEKVLETSPKQLREIAFTRDLINDVAAMRAARAETSRSNDATPIQRRQESFLASLRARVGAQPYAFVSFILMLGTCVYLIFSNSALRTRVEHLKAERAALENKQRELQQELANGQSQLPVEPRGIIPSIVLLNTVVTRSGDDLASVEIPPDTNRLQIQVKLLDETEYKSYPVSVETIKGQKVWGDEILAAGHVESGYLKFLADAEELKGDDYILVLRGRTAGERTLTIGEYPFRVKR